MLGGGVCGGWADTPTVRHNMTTMARINAGHRTTEEPLPCPSVVLDHFAKQFLHALPGDHKRLSARRRRSIHSANPPAVQCESGPQVPLPFHAVQDGIE